MRFGDNDNLAALTAVQLEAGGVFLFTDVDYLYTANPNVDPARNLWRCGEFPPPAKRSWHRKHRGKGMNERNYSERGCFLLMFPKGLKSFLFILCSFRNMPCQGSQRSLRIESGHSRTRFFTRHGWHVDQDCSSANCSLRWPLGPWGSWVWVWKVDVPRSRKSAFFSDSVSLWGIPCGILHGRHPERIYSFLSRLDVDEEPEI